MKNEKIKKILVWCAIVILIAILFIELFIERNISKSINFIEMSHYENRADLLAYISIIVTSIISYNIYNLSKKINQQNNVEKNRKKYESTCITYDYLNEIILYTKKIVFNDKEDYHILDYNNEFMKSVYNISKDVLDEKDIELIRKIDQSVRNYLNRDKNGIAEKLVIKWVYKNIFDMNMKIEQIEEINNIVDTDLLLSPQILLILSKLRKNLDYEYCKNIDYNEISLHVSYKKNNIIIHKNYDNNCCINNGDGNLEIYEPIFYSSNEFYRNGGMIYKGEVKNYLPHGEGIYYYYKSDKVKIFVNSDDLVDKTAVRIKKILQKEGIPERTNLIVKGQFKNGKILNGLIEFDDKNLGKIKVSENDYQKL